MRIILAASILFGFISQAVLADDADSLKLDGFWPPADTGSFAAYPKPIPVDTVERADEIPRLESRAVSAISSPAAISQTNEAVRVGIVGSAEQANLFEASASSGSLFLVLSTEWQNIHPKQKVAIDALEGKSDRSMGVSGLGGGGSPSSSNDFVERDVAYKVPRLVDHIYILVDGQAIALDPATETLSRGANPNASFGIAKQGQVRELQLAFQIPTDAANIALQVFDYSNGHLLIPLRGDVALAKRSDGSLDDALDKISTDVVELAALGLKFANNYKGEAAGSGWRFAVVQLGGQSVAGRDGDMGKILQFDPTKYAWINADGGFIFYASAGSTDAKGNIRFTPEIYQQQEVAFRVPESAAHLSMGLRINRDVVTLSLTDDKPAPMPNAPTRHQDGDVMEILFHGSRHDGEYIIVDLGIKPLAKGKGLEVRTARQFLLQTPEGELKPDAKATAALVGHPPEPFIVPPGTPVRFELAYRTKADPTALRVRGYRSEGSFEL